MKAEREMKEDELADSPTSVLKEEVWLLFSF